MSPKYEGELDDRALSDPNNTHGRVVSLVGCGKRVLEIGCATGYMTKILVGQQGCQVTALELDPQAAQLAKGFAAEVLTGDVQDPAVIRQLCGPFDAVVMADVLEHLRDPQFVLSGLWRLIAPGGSLIASVPNVAHWTVRAGLLRGHLDYGDRGILDRDHLRFFTRKSVMRLLQDSGYRVARFEATYVFPMHHRHGLGRLVARRAAPGWAQGLFGYQFIIQALPE